MRVRERFVTEISLIKAENARAKTAAGPAVVPKGKGNLFVLIRSTGHTDRSPCRGRRSALTVDDEIG